MGYDALNKEFLKDDDKETVDCILGYANACPYGFWLRRVFESA